MKKFVNGKKIDVDVIGGFEIEELGKKYVVCSYDDEPTSDEQLVMIFEIENIDGVENLVSIKSAFFNVLTALRINFKIS